MERRRLIAALKTAVNYEFGAEDTRNQVLEFIDRLSVGTRDSLEEALRKFTQRFSSAFKTEIVAFLAIDGKCFNIPSQPSPQNTHYKSRQTGEPESYRPVVAFEIDKHVIEIPVTHDTRLVIEIGSNEQSSDPTFPQFLKHLANQIRSLYTTIDARSSAEKERNAVSSLLGTNLHPPEIWAEFLSALVNYVPTWCPGSRKAQVTQLLITKPQDGTLHLVAGNGANSATSYVLISDSVTGMAVTKGWKEPTLLKIQSHHDNYIPYGKAPSDYELVVPIIFEDEIIAILNLEGDNLDDFNSLFASFCEDAALFVAPILKAALDRMATFRKTESRIYYVVSDVLKRLSDTFGHSISQPTTIALLSADELRSQLSSSHPDFGVMKQEAQKTFQSIKDIRDNCSVFAKGFPDLLHIGPQDVPNALQQRLGQLRKLAKPYGIELSLKIIDEHSTAFGSSLFVEHIFNICYNSYQQLQEVRRRTPKFRGRINVTIKKKKSVAPSGKDIGVGFIEVTVLDNGGGMESDLLSRMKLGPVTTKQGGNGYAIPAAAEFFASIGGSMIFKNFRGGLRTVFLLQEYAETRHKSAKLGQPPGIKE